MDEERRWMMNVERGRHGFMIFHVVPALVPNVAKSGWGVNPEMAS